MISRTGLMTFNGVGVRVLGDVHLGRKFVNGVPLDRRGEREEMVWTQFQADLHNVAGAKIHLQVGDLMDKMIMPPEVILRAAQLYREAAIANPDVVYALIAGNHDLSRDADRKSAFDVFEALVSDVANIKVVSGDAACLSEPGLTILLCPWHPFQSAAEVIQNYSGHEKQFDMIAGHWDVEDFGYENPNLIPLAALKAITKVAITGHDHRPCVKGDDDLQVIVTGSMQPYTFGEDPDGEMYLTFTATQLAANKLDLTNKCVRVLLKGNEQLPDDEINCLEFRVKRVEEDDPEAEEVEEAKIEAFDFKKLFLEAFEEAGVLDEIRDTVLDRYDELNTANAVE